MTSFDIREGERALAADPATAPPDAGLVFIGRIRSPWRERSECPRNLRMARERGLPASVEIDAAFRPGLEGLERASHIILLYWMDEARRDLIVQKPRHLDETRGVFALRSPVRPNPIGLGVVRLLRLDAHAGRLEIDAIDATDGTPLIDVKPYYPGIDAVPDAVTA